MIYIVGDIHAEWKAYWAAIQAVANDSCPGPKHLICTGEFGYWPRGQFKDSLGEPVWPPKLPQDLGVRLWWLDGNQEALEALEAIDALESDYCTSMDVPTLDGGSVELTYIPRAATLTIDGHKILFMGGSDSVPWDKASRIQKYQQKKAYGSQRLPTWFVQEPVTEQQIEKATSNVEKISGIEWVISHQPPNCFDMEGIKNLPTEQAPSRARLNSLLWHIDPKLWLFGDMHRRCNDEVDGIKWQGLNCSDLSPTYPNPYYVDVYIPEEDTFLTVKPC